MKHTLVVSVGLGAVLGLIRTSNNRQPANPASAVSAETPSAMFPDMSPLTVREACYSSFRYGEFEAMRGARHDLDDAYVPLLVGGVYAVSQGPKAVVSAWSTVNDYFLLGLFIDVAKKNRELWSERRGE